MLGQEAASGGAGALSVLRAVRLFRVFKLARQWKSMHTLLAKTLTTCYDIWPFAVLLFLFIYIFALLGMQFFANQMRFDDDGYPLVVATEAWSAAEATRLSFDNFMWAMTTVFVVLTGENWNSVMYDCWRGTNWCVTVCAARVIRIVANPSVCQTRQPIVKPTNQTKRRSGKSVVPPVAVAAVRAGVVRFDTS